MRDCTECGEHPVEQDKFDDDLCDIHYQEAIEQEAGDNAVKYAKENTWGWKT